MTTPTLPELEAEESSLILPYFDETMALLLGNAITAIAVARKSPVVINIRNANRCFFHASLPGSSAHNDNWARRKSNAALMTGHASLLIGMRHAAHNRTIEGEGWSLAEFADSGGAVPLRVAMLASWLWPPCRACRRWKIIRWWSRRSARSWAKARASAPYRAAVISARFPQSS